MKIPSYETQRKRFEARLRDIDDRLLEAERDMLIAQIATLKNFVGRAEKPEADIVDVRGIIPKGTA